MQAQTIQPLNNPHYDPHNHKLLRELAQSIYVNQLMQIQFDDLGVNQLAKLASQSWIAAATFADSEKNLFCSQNAEP
jgi:hypothetical protein